VESTTPLAPIDRVAHVDRLRAALAASPCDGVLVTHLVNARWLTGFAGSNASVLVTAGRLTLFTDTRYGEYAAAHLGAVLPEAEVVVVATRAELRERTAALVGGMARLGLEAEHVTWAEQRSYATEWFDGVELHPTAGLVEGLRRTKSGAEVERIETASALADRALDELAAGLAEGPTEREFARALDRRMVDLGAEGPSFPTICASGPNSSMPHHLTSDRRIRSGDLVVLDFGALVDGYHSDMTRTVAVGEPGAELVELVDAATEAQAAGAAAVRPGVTSHDVDRACRDALAGRGLEDLLLHGTGHGVGLDIHEVPILRPGGPEAIGRGEVITVEPGVYRAGLGGARTEDTVLVTGDGSRPLTRFPKSLLVV
jgi:Xaa-Pro aminopeptidase